MYDGLALVTDGIFAITAEYEDMRNWSSDEASYHSAFSLLGGCSEYASQTWLNTASAYGEISAALPSIAATGRVGAMTDWEQDDISVGLFGIQHVFSATKAYSLLSVTNDNSEAETFEVFVLSSYSGSAYGVSILNFSQVNMIVTNIPAKTSAEIPIMYWDGQNGGTPNTILPMEVYILGNNQSGTFFIDGFSHNWNPTLVTNGSVWQPLTVTKLQNGGVRPLGSGGSDSTNSNIAIENPVSSYVTQNSTNQTYSARVFVVNPFDQPCSVIVTQALPSGVIVLTTDGTLGVHRLFGPTPSLLAMSWKIPLHSPVPSFRVVRQACHRRQ